jgi:hypothetical protein
VGEEVSDCSRHEAQQNYLKELFVAAEEHADRHHEVLLHDVLHAVACVASQQQNVQDLANSSGSPSGVELRVAAQPKHVRHSRVLVSR